MIRNVETMLGYFSKIRRIYANELNIRFKEENFSPNEISILILLSNNKTINTSSQLTLILGVSKGLVSRSIESLISRGLIICSKDSADKRIQRIELSENARPVIHRLKEESAQISATLFSDISEDEIKQMESTMMKITKHFKEMEDEKNESKNVKRS